MNKKMIAAGLTVTLVFSSPTIAYLQDRLSIDQAAEQMEKNDLSQVKKAGDPKLDSDVQIYQSQFSDEMEDIQDLSTEWQDQSNELSKEMQYYQQLYNYWALEQQVKVSNEGLELVKEELSLMEKRFEAGLVSEAQVIEMKKNLNSQKAQHRSLLQQMNNMKFSLNQQLDQPVKQHVQLADPEFAKLPSSTYKAETVAEEQKKSHESLRLPRTVVSTYEDILDDVDDLDRIRTGGGTSALEDQLEVVQKEIEETTAALQALSESAPEGNEGDAPTDGSTTPTDGSQPTDGQPDAGSGEGQPPADVEASIQAVQGQVSALSAQTLQDRLSDLTTDAVLLQTQIGLIEAQQPDVASRSEAEEELEDYYQEMLQEANADLVAQLDAIEYLAYQYEETFNSLEDQLELQRENRDHALELYQVERERVQQGVATPSAVNQARQNLEQAKVQIIQTQKEYLVKKKEFYLFTQKGYLPRGS